MKILFLAKYGRQGPSSRYRIFQFLPYLERAGIGFDVQVLLDDRYLERLFAGTKPSFAYFIERFLKRVGKLIGAGGYDVVFIEREVFPHIPEFAEFILHRFGAKLVLDMDDAIFLLYENAPSAIRRRLLGEKLPRILRRCQLVLAGSSFIRKYALRYTDNVVFFPTVVDTERFRPRAWEPSVSPPVIGWIGSPVTAAYLARIAPALARLAKHEEFVFSLVGVENFEIDGVRVAGKTWNEGGEVEDLQRFDIGVMPLEASDWCEGKCALKLLQYMSVAVPSVSSPVGTAREVVEDGVNGFLAASVGDWESKLRRLVRSPQLRAEVGKAGRKWIEEHYNLARYGPRFVDYLDTVAVGRPIYEVAR